MKFNRAAVFENCRGVKISGGIFNVTQVVEAPSPDGQSRLDSRAQPIPMSSSDFRTIRMGDLDFLEEVGKEDIVEYREFRRRRTGTVVRRIPVVVGARRIYRARIFGVPDTVTAVVYDDPNFESVRVYSTVTLCRRVKSDYSESLRRCSAKDFGTT
jgi:hypothetical protein